MKHSFFFTALLLLTMSSCDKRTRIEIDVTGTSDNLALELYQDGIEIGCFYQENGSISQTIYCDSLPGDDAFIELVTKDRQTRTYYGAHEVYLSPHDKVVVTGTGNNSLRWNIKSNHPGQLFTEGINSGCIDLIEKVNNTMAQLAHPTPGANLDSIQDVFRNIKKQISIQKAKNLASLPADSYWLEYFAIMTKAFDPQQIKKTGMEPGPELTQILQSQYSRLSEADKQTEYGKTITRNLLGE